MKIIFNSVILSNINLFFYKCIDPIYLLEYYSAKIVEKTLENNEDS